jgi:hypothetical protein
MNNNTKLVDKRKPPFIWIYIESLSRFKGNPSAAFVYLHIVRRAGHDGTCWQSIDGMASDCGISTGTLKRALAFLLSQGMITRCSRKGRSSLYKVTSIEEWKEPGSNLTQVKKDPGKRKPRSNPTHLPGSNLTQGGGSNLTYELDPIEIDSRELDPSVYSKPSENLDEQPTHTPAESKDLNSDQGKEENEALEKISSEEPESKVKNLANPDKLENPKKESSAKERKVSAAAENSTSPPGYAPKTAVGTFPDESAILNAWNGLKAQKWRAMAAGTIVGSSILGIQFFLNHANGDPSGAVTLFKKTLEVAANDDYFKKMSLRPNQALDPNSSAFIGHFLGDALQAEKPAPVSPAPAPAHTTEPIQPTFFFGGL